MIHHLFPLGDTRDHRETMSCECHPIRQDRGNKKIAIHNMEGDPEVVVGAEVIMGIRCKECLRYVDESWANATHPHYPYR